MCGPTQYTTCHMTGDGDAEKRKNKPGNNPQSKKESGRGGRGSKGVKGGKR